MVRTRFALILYFRITAACHTLSKAFLKSMKTWYRFCWCWRYFSHRILKNIVSAKWSFEESLSSFIRRVIQLPNSAKFFSISFVKCFQYRLPKIRKFQHELIVKIIVQIVNKFNLPMAL